MAIIVSHEQFNDKQTPGRNIQELSTIYIYIYSTPLLNQDDSGNSLKLFPRQNPPPRGFVCMVAWSMLAVEMLRLDMEVLKAAPRRFHFLKIAL